MAHARSRLEMRGTNRCKSNKVDRHGHTSRLWVDEVVPRLFLGMIVRWIVDEENSKEMGL